MGRPTALTEKVQRDIVQAIAAGNYYEAACARAGIDYPTFRRWMKWGESGLIDRQRFREFRDAVLEAEGQAEVRIVAQWQQQIPENWQAARDFLARRFPERWANREKVEHAGPGGGPMPIRIVEVAVERPVALPELPPGDSEE